MVLASVFLSATKLYTVLINIPDLLYNNYNAKRNIRILKDDNMSPPQECVPHIGEKLRHSNVQDVRSVMPGLRLLFQSNRELGDLVSSKQERLTPDSCYNGVKITRSFVSGTTSVYVIVLPLGGFNYVTPRVVCVVV